METKVLSMPRFCCCCFRDWPGNQHQSLYSPKAQPCVPRTPAAAIHISSLLLGWNVCLGKCSVHMLNHDAQGIVFIFKVKFSTRCLAQQKDDHVLCRVQTGNVRCKGMILSLYGSSLICVFCVQLLQYLNGIRFHGVASGTCRRLGQGI